MLRWKKYARLTLLLAAGALLLVVLLYPSDEKRVLQAAEALLDGASQSQAALSRALELHASPDVSVSVADLPEPLRGHQALLEAAAGAQGLGHELQFRFEQPDVSLEGGRARVSADLIVSYKLGLRRQRQLHHASATFQKLGGRFVLQTAEVGPEHRDQPEARP